MLPITCCQSQGAIVCLCFPSHVPHVRKIAHRKVPLCAYGSHRKVPSCAKFPIARCHRVPRMPIAWCIRVPSCPRQGAIGRQYCPSQGAIVCLCCPTAWATMCHGSLSHGSLVSKLPTSLCQGGHVKVPSCAKLPIARCNRVPSYPSQGVIACQVSHRKVALRGKFPSQGAIEC